jgi:ssDNA-binding Zn-finger/Zn-ribbon topoisomerase 1
MSCDIMLGEMKMPIQPKSMKVQCPQCYATDIFMPKSDVFAFFPTCKKCGTDGHCWQGRRGRLGESSNKAFRVSHKD